VTHDQAKAELERVWAHLGHNGRRNYGNWPEVTRPNFLATTAICAFAQAADPRRDL
jgi:hypothetical protein